MKRPFGDHRAALSCKVFSLTRCEIVVIGVIGVIGVFVLLLETLCG